MKEKTKKADKALEAHWEKVASLYENPKTSMKMLERSRSLTPAECRKFLGKAKTKAVSIRIPEDDLHVCLTRLVLSHGVAGPALRRH